MGSIAENLVAVLRVLSEKKNFILSTHHGPRRRAGRKSASLQRPFLRGDGEVRRVLSFHAAGCSNGGWRLQKDRAMACQSPDRPQQRRCRVAHSVLQREVLAGHSMNATLAV